ncbi:type II secretion system F family protein [Pandoraea sp.]|uniref:type II secretion system F family protein n=1 Tax=Pandoraea sp. TaxID=1883445 RepID=UPI0012042227|nr:type II secretion system F family protein [Pandoraea sp.]TAL53349.1 MAG: pilus assembly protein [Pandoraea sp.]TAM20438.1 MAG: pilus assembly protein [Pandoraea sp.]
MTPVDIVTAAGFFSIVIIGLIVSALRDMLRRRPGRRVQERMRGMRQTLIVNKPAPTPGVEVELFERPTESGALKAWLQRHAQRVHTVSGAAGMRLIYLSAFAGLVLAVIVVALSSPPGWSRPLLYLGVPLLAVRMAYRFLIARFRNRFLAVFPDTLDLIIRAVRAGIPAVQAISTAGDETEEPVRSTFRILGDSLRLGAELKDVLDKAVERVQIADFSFFAVCLLLQRETGGNLGETLENLANIIRTRRDIRMKTKALTAEGRIASKIISAVPFAIVGLLYLIDRPYISLLFEKPLGHHILELASVLMAVGLAMINKIAKLDTSR